MTKYYHNELKVFNKVKSDTLPQHHKDINHKIIFEEGKKPDDLKFNPLNKMTVEELEEYRKYITDNLQKGFIEANSAP